MHWIQDQLGQGSKSWLGDIIWCFWARHLTHTVPLSTQEYKWVPGNVILGVTLQ